MNYSERIEQAVDRIGPLSCILLLCLTSLQMASAQMPAFGRHHIPEEPFVPEVLEEAKDAPGLGLGFFFSAPGGDGYPAPPFLSTTDYQRLHNLLTGEEHIFHQPGKEEQSGPHYLIEWPELTMENDATSPGGEARIRVTMQAADGRMTIVRLPVYARGESHGGLERIIVDGENARENPGLVSAGVIAFKPGEIQRRRIEYWRSAKEGAASASTTLSLPLSSELFSLLVIDWPQGTNGTTHELAVSGLSPAAVRQLPVDKKGRSRLLVLPSFDSMHGPVVDLIWAPKGEFSKPAPPVKSIIENTFILTGPVSRLISERIYEFPTQEAFSGGVSILYPFDMKFSSIITEPACEVIYESGHPLKVRPLDPDTFADASTITIRLETPIAVSALDRTRLPNLQDTSYCVSENFHFERPGHIGVTFFVAHGIAVIPEEERPQPQLQHHLVGDSFTSRYRRTGYSTLEAYVRTTLSAYHPVRHKVDVAIKERDFDVTEKLLFGSKDKPTSAPKTLSLWMPYLEAADEVKVGTANGDKPTTQSLENDILKLEWEVQPQRDSLVLEYTVPQMRVQQPQRIAPPFLKLPISLAQGYNQRFYEARVASESETEGILYRSRNDDWWEVYPSALPGGDADSTPTAYTLAPAPQEELRIHTLLEGNLKKAPRWPIIQVFDQKRAVKNLKIEKE